MRVKLCGEELELNIDMADAGEVERLEKSVEELVKNLSDMEKDVKKRYSQIIRGEVIQTRAWLDKMFGEGTGNKVLAEDGSLHDVYHIVNTMSNLHRIYSAQITNEALNKALEKYSPKRAKRIE